jgi:hypothetical protein
MGTDSAIVNPKPQRPGATVPEAQPHSNVTAISTDIQRPLGSIAVIDEPQQAAAIEFLQLRGIRFTDRNESGNIDWSDVLEQLDTNHDHNLLLEEINTGRPGDAAILSQTLFNLIDQGMLVGENRSRNGVLTQQEITYAMSVIQRYARVIGMEVSAVLTSYNGATSFANRDLNALQTVQREIISALTEHLGTPTIIGNRVRETLQALGYDARVIAAVMRLIEDVASLTAELVASCILRVVEAARNGHDIYSVSVSNLPAFPEEEEISPEVIQGWLRGEATVDDNILFTNPAIRERFLRLFDYSHRRNPDQQTGDAQRFVLYLLSLGNLGQRRIALAERAMEIFGGTHTLDISPANRRQYLPYLEGQADWAISGVDGSDEVNGALANAYLGVPNITTAQVEQALVHVRLLTNAEQKGRLAQQLVGLCMGAGRRNAPADHNQSERVTMLDMAFSIAREFEQIPERLETLRQIAEAYQQSTAVRAEGREEGNSVRATALEVLRFIQTQDPNHTFNIQGRQGPNPVSISTLIEEYNEEQFEAISVYAIRQRVFPQGSNPERIAADAIPGAMQDLQAILNASEDITSLPSNADADAATRARFAERACAEQLMAEIVSARASQLALPLEARSNVIERSTAFQLHELAAYLARQAYLDFITLAGQIGETEGTPQMPAHGYTRRAYEVNGITARTVFRLAPLWQTRQDGNRGQRVRNAAQIRAAFRDLLAYIPSRSMLPNMESQQTANAAEAPYHYSEYVKGRLVLERDDRAFTQDQIDDRFAHLTGSDAVVNGVADDATPNILDRYLDISPAGGRASVNTATETAPSRPARPHDTNRENGTGNELVRLTNPQQQALTNVQQITAESIPSNAAARITALETAVPPTGRPANVTQAISSAHSAVELAQRRASALEAVEGITVESATANHAETQRLIDELGSVWAGETRPLVVAQALRSARIRNLPVPEQSETGGRGSSENATGHSKVRPVEGEIRTAPQQPAQSPTSPSPTPAPTPGVVNRPPAWSPESVAGANVRPPSTPPSRFTTSPR